MRDYNVRFEELKVVLLKSHPTLNKSYFVSRFINSLNDTLRAMVKMMHLAMTQQVVERAGMQEWVLEAICRKYGLPPKSYLKSS